MITNTHPDCPHKWATISTSEDYIFQQCKDCEDTQNVPRDENKHKRP